MKVPDPCPFTPGTGATPSALTGREREQAVLRRCLADLLGGASPPHDTVLTGPRGTGKTVLLNRFKRACGDRATEVDEAALTSDTPTQEALVEILGPPPGMTKLLARYWRVRRAWRRVHRSSDQARAVRMAETTESSRTGERGSIRRTVPNGMTAGIAPGGLAP